MPDPPPKRRWKLWHLSVAVLLAALIFQLLRELIGRSDQPLVFACFFVVGVGIFFMFFWAGLKVANRVALALLKWGESRGGLAGFVTPVIAVLVDILCGLGAIVLGSLTITAAGYGLIYYLIFRN